MKYHVINTRTFELKTLNASEILDMDYDTEGRVIVVGTGQKEYYLLTHKDLIQDP